MSVHVLWLEGNISNISLIWLEVGESQATNVFLSKGMFIVTYMLELISFISHVVIVVKYDWVKNDKLVLCQKAVSY